MAKGVFLFSCVLLVSAVSVALGQQQQSWLRSNPWGHGPVQQPAYQQQQQQQQQRPPYQAPTYQQSQQAWQQRQQWQQPQAQQWQQQRPPAQQWQQPQYQAGAAAAAAAAPPPTTTAGAPVEVEPIEVEGPVSTTTPLPPTQAPYRYPANWNQQQTQPRYNPPPTRTWGAQPAANAWQQVPPPQQPQQPQQPFAGQWPPQQPQQPQQPPQQPPQGANPMSRYDVFSSAFDSQAFHAARDQARASTPATPTMDPMKMLSQALQGALGMGPGQGGAPAWPGMVGAFGPTTPKPVVTTPDYRVGVNPYRQGGFYLAPTNFKPMPKPTTQIIDLSQQQLQIGEGVTFNPFEGFLGNTPPPAKKPTTPLPGKNGDYFSGFLGFHEATTASPRSDVNAVNPKYAQYFAPVPVDNGPSQNTPNSWGGAPTNAQESPANLLSQLSPQQLAQALCAAQPMFCNNPGGAAGKR